MSTYDPESLPEAAALALAELEARRERDRLARDAGAGRDLRTDERRHWCMKRMVDGSWCTLPDGHGTPCGTHHPIAPGPAIPPPDRKLMNAFRAELSEKYDDKPRPNAWTDRFGELAPAGMSPAQRWCWRIER